MKHKKILISIFLAALCVLGFLFIRERYVDIADRTLKNVKIDYPLIFLGGDIWGNYKIPIVVESDAATHKMLQGISYSTKKTTVRELLNTVVPDSFVWRTEGKVIHIISKSLDVRSDYQLNASIEAFSGTEDYNDLILKALVQIRQRNFPEQLTYSPFPYERYGIKQHVSKFHIRAHNVTIRQLLDKIALKGGIGYSVRRTAQRDGTYSIYVEEEMVSKK